ncbi:hypothetical protein M405DRAFT_240980 [Rhizopogon salebrosus TDB-379]|nr:hypothetical protein M405DRAFT_240980 [Rhizopogon salebrosus TDB-379]
MNITVIFRPTPRRPPAQLEDACRLPQGVFDDLRDGIYSSATRGSHPRSSATPRRRAFVPCSGSGARAPLDNLSLRSDHSDTLVNQRNSSNAQGKVSPLVMGRCRAVRDEEVRSLWSLIQSHKSNDFCAAIVLIRLRPFGGVNIRQFT